MRTLGLIAVLASAAPAAAQPSPYHIKQLAPGVHVVIRDVTRGKPYLKYVETDARIALHARAMRLPSIEQD